MNILLIRISAIGDVLLTGPIIRALKNRFPEGNIHLLTSKESSEIARGFPEISKIHILEKKLSRKQAAIKELSRMKWDYVIDLQNNYRSRTITSKLKVKKVYRFQRMRFNRLVRIHFPHLRSRVSIPPAVALQYLHSAKQLGLEDDDEGLHMIPLPEWTRSAEDILSEFVSSRGIDDYSPLLIIAPGAKHATKQYPPEYFVELCEFALQEGFRSICLIGSPAEKELAGFIQGRLGEVVLNTVGKVGLGEVVGLISMGDLVISGDSAPAHISAALKTPLVTIFGPTVPEFGFAPLRTPHSIAQLENLICRPCHPHGQEKCPLKHFKCMKDLKPNAVWEIALNLWRDNHPHIEIPSPETEEQNKQ